MRTCFCKFFNTPRNPGEVGQPSPVDVIMTNGDACPTNRGDLVASLLRYEYPRIQSDKVD